MGHFEMTPRSMVAVLAAAALCVSACGSNGKPGPKASATRTPATPSVTASAAFTSCESLDALTTGTTIKIAPPPKNSFQPPLMDIAAHPFTLTNGTTTSAGEARTENGGKAGGSNVEIRVNNLLLSIAVGQAMQAVQISFGEYGGNLNLRINNTLQNFDNFSAMNGKTVGGVTIQVPSGGFGNDKGVLRLIGTINDLAVGGQELWIDNICFDK
ncbi:hypothetical protein [Frankia sp. CiP3]|uniref:hypothetical protein n=1 Tax=Frankia sp. CiP3 TaxID=2880971 RepID=UPI001EF7115C|nr:hypothetical protein [Frankia sp. CiP3]